MGKVVSSIGNAVSGAARGVTQAVKAVVQPVYNATLKQIPGVDKALVGLDKAVGNTIPGGWGTVASVASSFIPGAQLAAMGMTKAGLATGLGALSGSGVMRKGNQFNLQGAIMGGAMAYGASQLAAGLESAGKAGEGGAAAAVEGVTESGIGSLSPEQLKTLTSADTGILNQLSAGIEGGAGSGLQAAPEAISGAIPNISGSLATTAPVPGSVAAQNAYELQGLQEGYESAFREPSMLDKIGTSISEAPKNVGNFLDKATTGSTYEGLGTNLAEAGKGTLSNIGDAGQGIANLAGFGAESGTAAAARTAFTDAITKEGVIGGVLGAAGLSELEKQKDLLTQQYTAGTIPQDQYNEAVARIDAEIATARQAVSENPFNENPDRTPTKTGNLYTPTTGTNTLYGKFGTGIGTDADTEKETLYAKGGEVQHYFAGGLTRGFEKFMAEQEAANAAAAQAAETAKAQAPGIAAVAASPWNTNPDKGIPSLGISIYNKGADSMYGSRNNSPEALEYEQLAGRNYAVGGPIDDESGMDDVRGLYQGNMSNGFMNRGSTPSYAAGGQVDMGNGFDPFAQLQRMMGPLGGIGAQANAQTQPSFAQSPYPQAPFNSSVNTTTQQDMMGGNMNSSGDSFGAGIGGGQQLGYGGGGGQSAFPLQGQYGIVKMAAGGMPRFLSGGGDGMSDSIKASINGTQEARLADGEFVIPADVVSHLGNGSSKAGAKQLYSMMDRVRKVRTGNKKQGKQINPRKYMAA